VVDVMSGMEPWHARTRESPSQTGTHAIMCAGTRCRRAEKRGTSHNPSPQTHAGTGSECLHGYPLTGCTTHRRWAHPPPLAAGNDYLSCNRQCSCVCDCDCINLTWRGPKARHIHRRAPCFLSPVDPQAGNGNGTTAPTSTGSAPCPSLSMKRRSAAAKTQKSSESRDTSVLASSRICRTSAAATKHR
jgi:hypothetical protein